MKPIKHAVSFAIFHSHDDTRVLVVLRPDDDEHLPNMWGLPAASLRTNETWHDAVVRAGREKLGVDVEIGTELNRGETERADYALEMRLFEARITHGIPTVPQANTVVTQYQAWKWDESDVLQAAARSGSLCCRLFLERSSR